MGIMEYFINVLNNISSTIIKILFMIFSIFSFYTYKKNKQLIIDKKELELKVLDNTNTIQIQKKIIDVTSNYKPVDINTNIERMRKEEL
jgi:hypothetical protein